MAIYNSKASVTVLDTLAYFYILIKEKERKIMAKINDIKNIIASAAAKNNMPTYENGNTALK